MNTATGDDTVTDTNTIRYRAGIRAAGDPSRPVAWMKHDTAQFMFGTFGAREFDTEYAAQCAINVYVSEVGGDWDAIVEVIA